MGIPELSIVILNYRNEELTRTCVEHALKALGEARIDGEVLVVDNSGPETGNLLRETLADRVKLIINDRNLGFAAANNQGIRASRGEYILLLNNDAVATSESLRLGLGYLKEHPTTAVWAPALVGADGEPQVSAAQLPTLCGLASEYLRLPKPKPLQSADMRRCLTEVESVNGACILTRRRTVDVVGLLDERFFFTVEDLDFCKRVLDQGYQIVYDPRCSIVHLGGASQDYRWLNDPYLHNARVKYFAKHHGWLQAIPALAIVATGLFLRRARRVIVRLGRTRDPR